MMWSMRPSILGLLSAVAMSCVASTILFSIFQPSSVCAISRPCWIGRMPSCAPSALTTRTSRTRIPSLMRISFAWLRCVAPPGWPPGPAWRWKRPAARSRAAHGETGRARGDLAREVGQHPVEGDRAAILTRPVPETDGPVLALPLADHEHVRDLLELRLADPVAELFVAVVELPAHARVAQL